MNNLKFIRQQTSLTQADVAKKLKIPTTTYANYEQNRTFPSAEILIGLADVFGCSIDYLLGHQTATILQLDMLSKSQQELFGLMKKMTDKQVDKLIGYANSLLSVPLDDVVDKIYNEGRK